ncbi:MAG TPA: prepilin-type N-terminal cleavage/methylation domain-containing protein [Candidatus Acidoferrum sp.]|jgi:general secretion pathway protein G|nr:prepilin-type N-terminal cleavage/methylation domain-containing protein [Candidatus Acidoferrum sp.]
MRRLKIRRVMNPNASSARRVPRFGFTLIELMIVITIIFILLGLAAGRYDRSVVRAREATLKQDLQVMRQAIDNYTLDKQSAPQSIEALQEAGYLRIVPTDPMTQAKDWQPQFDEVVLSPDQTGTGMVDVHSNSDKTSPFDGTPYKDW